MIEKRADLILHKTAPQKMLPELYRTCLQSQLSISQLHTLELVVWLLQQHKQVRIAHISGLSTFANHV